MPKSVGTQPAAGPGVTHHLLLRARADRRIVLAAATGAVAFDIAARIGIASGAATASIAVISAGLVLSGRVRGLTGRILIGAAPLFGLLLGFRASPWVIVPTTVAVAVVLVLGVSHGADDSALAGTFAALATRMWLVLGHLVLAAGMFRLGPERPDAAKRHSLAIARGLLLGVPVALAIGLLLAWADPIFRSWFDLNAIVSHLILAAAGAWLVIGLARAASARQPSPTLPPPPALGTVEAVLILGSLCGLYLAFVAAQLVALSDGGHHVLVTEGLTWAQYARSGFFQLLACAAITLVVLLAVRACADPDVPAVAGLSALTAALTVAVVVVAVWRLQLYEATFGLTLLRLACLVAAGWIGAVFLMLGATIPRRGLPRRRFAALVVASGLALIGAWGIANPAAIVAQTNLSRAGNGHAFDLSQVAVLGPDAVPTMLANLHQAENPRQITRALCSLAIGKTTLNLSRASAHTDLARACAPYSQSLALNTKYSVLEVTSMSTTATATPQPLPKPAYGTFIP
jgi:hypothetical protein